MVATANVRDTLSPGDARGVLASVLALGPDLVGLQEWGLGRRRILRETRGYLWSAPVLGGCVVGASSERYDRLGWRLRMLSPPGRADRREGRWGLEPSRIAAVGVFRDRHCQRTVALLSYHLVYGVQAGGRYRDDRPALVARHGTEVLNLQRLVDRHLDLGHVVHAVGDSNFAGLRLAGLTSAWDGHEDHPGTLGERKVDDVHGPGPATSLTLVSSASDHKAVLAARPDIA